MDEIVEHTFKVNEMQAIIVLSYLKNQEETVKAMMYDDAFPMVEVTISVRSL